MNNFVEDLLILLDKGLIEFKSFIEFLALQHGQKNVVRLVVDEPTYLVLEKLCKKHGIAFLKSDFNLKLAFTTSLLDTFYEITSADNPDSDRFVIFCGNKETAIEACSVERDGCDVEETARIYGYPKCCAQNYQRVQNGEHWVVPYLTNASSTGPYSWLNNKVAYLFQPHLTIIPDYFPCAIDCEKTHNLAQRYASLLRDAGLHSILNIIRDSLRLPLLFHDGYIYQFSDLKGQSGRYINRGNVTILPYGNRDVLGTQYNIQEISFQESGAIALKTDKHHLALELCSGSTELLFFT